MARQTRELLLALILPKIHHYRQQKKMAILPKSMLHNIRLQVQHKNYLADVDRFQSKQQV